MNSKAGTGGWKVHVTLSEGTGGEGKGEGEGWLLHGWGLLCYCRHHPPAERRAQLSPTRQQAALQATTSSPSWPQGPGALTPSISHIQQL